MTYHYNPHSHIKVWLSNNPDVFMNFENQTRMIEMREKNPTDPIHLVYDASLLNDKARNDLKAFCDENQIIPVNADSEEFRSPLETDTEINLYQHYKDEITHLKKGGNLGVASDILRWLPSCYRLASYTDLDDPLDTNNFSTNVLVEAPIIINVGTLKLFGSQEMIIALNEYIAVVDEQAARPLIEKVQKGMLSKLQHLDSDYVEKTEETFKQDGIISRYLVGYMKNRAEALYIQKLKQFNTNDNKLSSRILRKHINDIMSNENEYLSYHRLDDSESNDAVIKRLRSDLNQQLSWIKWLFFNEEYREIKQLLALNDQKFIKAMMKKERSLFLKSIVICTTGPIELTRSFFGDYMIPSKEVDEKVRPYAMSHYGLEKAFLSNNVIPLHENALGMLRYMGAKVGERNDSSWLEEGQKLQSDRQAILQERRQQLIQSFPSTLLNYKDMIEAHIAKLEQEDKGWFAFLFRTRRQAKLSALRSVLSCFDEQSGKFDITALKEVMKNDVLPKQSLVYAGFFSHKTRDLIEGLSQVCHEAVVLRVARDKTPSYTQSANQQSTNQMQALFASPISSSAQTLTASESAPAKPRQENPSFNSPFQSPLAYHPPSDSSQQGTAFAKSP
ncbi:glycosyltransferase family 88 protein [Legionella sp. W05-934-2]|uniref:glycosyltransferase family 88 protein n=1 Tax=Legionella sp. W05-934-2 TaxID=1198649 RepID=UPI0034636D50